MARLATEETADCRAEVLERLNRSYDLFRKTEELAAKSRAAIARSNELLNKAAVRSLS